MCVSDRPTLKEAFGVWKDLADTVRPFDGGLPPLSEDRLANKLIQRDLYKPQDSKNKPKRYRKDPEVLP